MPKSFFLSSPGVRTFGMWLGELGGMELLDEMLDDNGPFFTSKWLLLLWVLLFTLLLLLALMELLFIIDRPLVRATLWRCTILLVKPKPDAIWLWCNNWLDGSDEMARYRKCMKEKKCFCDGNFSLWSILSMNKKGYDGNRSNWLEAKAWNNSKTSRIRAQNDYWGHRNIVFNIFDSKWWMVHKFTIS